MKTSVAIILSLSCSAAHLKVDSGIRSHHLSHVGNELLNGGAYFTTSENKRFGSFLGGILLLSLGLLLLLLLEI
jgi:hypothetical protein